MYLHLAQILQVFDWSMFNIYLGASYDIIEVLLVSNTLIYVAYLISFRFSFCLYHGLSMDYGTLCGLSDLPMVIWFTKFCGSLILKSEHKMFPSLVNCYHYE